MNASAIRVLFDYNAWAYAQVWSLVKTLSVDEFLYEIDYSLGSLRNHLVHVASVDARWIARVRGADLPGRLNPADYQSAEDVSRLWAEVYSEIDAFLRDLSDDTVRSMCRYTARGAQRESESWKILLHVINHGTDHRAQMYYTLHQLDKPTVDQDFVYYLRDELPPRGLVSVTADIIRALFRYDGFSTRRLAGECMAGLTDEQLDRQLGHSQGTLREQLGYIMYAQQYWLERVSGNAMPDDLTAVFTDVQAYINQVDDDALMEPVEYQSSRGQQFANIRWEMLWHMVNHTTDFRAQTLAMLHEVGAPTFEQDLMIYFWDQES